MTLTKETENLTHLIDGARLPQGAECEILRLQTKRRSVGWADHAPDIQGMSQSDGFSLRVLLEGGEGLLKVPKINKDNFQGLVDRAMAVAKNTPKDPARFLGKPPVGLGQPIPTDSGIFKESAALLLEELKDLEETALKSSPKLKKVVRLYTEEEEEHKTIVNNLGVNLTTSSTSTSFLVEVLAEEAQETEISWEGLAARFGSDIKKKDVLLEAARMAVLALGGKPLASGVYTILIHPRVGTQLLSLLAQALSAQAVQAGRSFLKDLLGKEVGSKNLSVVDDPGRPHGLASTLFDDEAVPCSSLPVIEKGILKNYFYDLRTAKKAHVSSNGRGFRPGLGNSPSPQPTNFFIEPGVFSMEQLLSAEKTVFLLHDIMGLHMAEPVTGEFSLGASGFLYENGRLLRPVRGMTLAGTVSSLLKNATAVGNTVHWMSSFGAPPLLVNGLTLSGN